MKKEKYLNFIIYQIYPRSFYDSNGDGVGDLRGIREKIPYLLSLGVNAVWICPFYKSPNFDNGYDVSDYKDVAEEFGDLDEWKALKKELKQNGIALIMDLVVNHTSSHHFWFQEAKKSKDNPYHDYYIWGDKPLSSFRSVFGGNAWEYNKETNEYYLHSFAVEQPDLNWENPKVRKEMREIVDFWTDLGVDGFRIDVLDYIAKDLKKNKPYGGKNLRAYIEELFVGKDLFTVAECQAGKKEIDALCGKKGLLSTVFQFDHVRLGGKDKYLPRPFSLDDFKNTLVRWQYLAEKKGFLYSLFTDNHDQPFLLSAFCKSLAFRYEIATLLAGMVYLLKGIPFIFQGQEIGQVNSFYPSISDFSDVETQNYYNEKKGTLDEASLLIRINAGSRDNPRRPMAWTDDEKKNFGFSLGKPWLKPPKNAKEINVEKESTREKSVLAFYKKLIALRKQTPALIYGDFTCIDRRKGIFVFERTFRDTRIRVYCNFERPRNFPLLPRGELLFCNKKEREENPLARSFFAYEIAVYKL